MFKGVRKWLKKHYLLSTYVTSAAAIITVELLKEPVLNAINSLTAPVA